MCLWWAVLSGCDGAAALRGAALPTVALPRSEGAVARDVSSVDLLLAANGLFLDPRPWYDAVPSADPHPVGPGLLLELKEWEIAPPPGHELALPRVSEVLQVLAGEGAAPPLLLRAPPDAPFELARRVIFSAQMAGYPAIDLAIAGAGDEVLRVPLRFLPPCGEDVLRSGECLFPVITETDAGWEVWAESSEAVGADCAPGLLPRGAAAWWHKELVTAPGACPSAADLASLSSFLGELTRRHETCGGWVAPRSDATWQEALDGLAAVRGSGLAASGFGTPRSREPSSCEAAFVAAPSPVGAGSESSETRPALPAR